MNNELRARVEEFAEGNGGVVQGATQLLRTLSKEDEDHPRLANLAEGYSEYCAENNLGELSKLLKAAAAKARAVDEPGASLSLRQ